MLSLPPDGSFVFQIVAFLIFWMAMRRLLFDRVQAVLEERERRGKGLRSEAEAVVEEAVSLEARNEAAVAQAREEAARRADEIRRLAETEERAIVERARNQGADMVAKAREAVEREVDVARRDIGQGARDLAAAVAAAIMGRPV